MDVAAVAVVAGARALVAGMGAEAVVVVGTVAEAVVAGVVAAGAVASGVTLEAAVVGKPRVGPSPFRTNAFIRIRTDSKSRVLITFLCRAQYTRPCRRE